MTIRSRPRDTDSTTMLVALVGVLAGAGVLWAGAALAALITGHPAPAFTGAAIVAVVTQPGDPAGAWGQPMPTAVLV